MVSVLVVVVQGLSGDKLFLGDGAAVEKSVELLLLSVHPFAALHIAFLEFGAGALLVSLHV
jgi:hypothetical protein